MSIHIEQSESGALLNLGRRYVLTVRVRTESRHSLVNSWADLMARIAEWRERRGDRACEVILFYKVEEELVPCTKRLLAIRLLCREETVFEKIKVSAFVVGPKNRFHCEIGLPSLI